MKTKQAEYRTDISHLAEKMAERDKEAAQCEMRLIFAMIAIVGVGLTIFGFLTTNPTP